MSCILPASFHFSTQMVSIVNRNIPEPIKSYKNKRVAAIAGLGVMILGMVAFPIFLPITMRNFYNRPSTKVACISALDIPLAVILYFPIVACKIVQLALAALIHPAIAFKS